MPLKNKDISSLCLKWANHDESAARFLENIAALARLGDDLADGDASNPHAYMADLLFRALIVHSSNDFFMRHREALTPVIANAINMWALSEEWKDSSNRKTRMFAFVHRESVEQIVGAVSMLTGGPVNARQALRELHQLSHIQGSDESFEDWESA